MYCAFCDKKIIKLQLYFETKNEYVLYNNIPILPGHSLVVPKRHASSIQELNSDEIKSLFETVKLVAQKLKKIYEAEGMNFAFNEGSCAGQRVSHLHIHILPRKPNDMTPDPRNLYYRTEKQRKRLTQEEIRKMVASLKNKFRYRLGTNPG